MNLLTSLKKSLLPSSGWKGDLSGSSGTSVDVCQVVESHPRKI